MFSKGMREMSLRAAAVVQGQRFVSTRLAIESDDCDCEKGRVMAHELL